MKGKKLVLGICGSIAAYKSAFLVRRLVQEGAQVRVVMTDDAQSFITALTLSTLSGQEVWTTFYDQKTGQWNNHVELAEWADMILIAPLSACTLSKMACGHCDNILLALYLSACCPVVVAPAMDREMYRHTSTQDNLARIQTAGVYILEPEEGELASGLYGLGRMREPETIVQTLKTDFFTQRFKKKRVLITAGPTYEHIDPVRFMGNASSGKMGYALAESFSREGAEVSLVMGPGLKRTLPPHVKEERVVSAAEMLEASADLHASCDVAVFAAAVADYRPIHRTAEKIKKRSDAYSLKLEPTPDICHTLGQQKKRGQVHVGFALEVNQGLNEARKKLKNKNLDMIVLNTLADQGAGFGHDTNKVTLLDKNGLKKAYALKPKSEVACDIVHALHEYIEGSVCSSQVQYADTGKKADR